MRLPGDALRYGLQVPQGVVDEQAELGCLVMSSPNLPKGGLEHGAIRRSQQRSITYCDPRWGHADNELVCWPRPSCHPSPTLARHRISPSRRP